jgi:hypothetical protein
MQKRAEETFEDIDHFRNNQSLHLTNQSVNLSVAQKTHFSEIDKETSKHISTFDKRQAQHMMKGSFSNIQFNNELVNKENRTQKIKETPKVRLLEGSGRELFKDSQIRDQQQSEPGSAGLR